MFFIKDAIDHWRNIKRDYAEFLKNVDKPLEVAVNRPDSAVEQNTQALSPMTLEELKEKRAQDHETALAAKELDPVRDFLTVLKKNLGGFDEYDDAELERMKALEEPDLDSKVQELVSKAHYLRDFIVFSYYYRNKHPVDDPFPSWDEVKEMLISIELEDEYVDVVERFYVPSSMGHDIIEALLQ
jgi:hypothetical protein